MDYKNVNDYEVLYMIRENSEEARDLMYEKYLPIIKNITNKYYSYNKNLGADYDDYFQEALIGFQKAILSYNEDRNVLFYTYAPNVINKQLLNFIRSLKVEKHLALNSSIRNDEFLKNIRDKKAFRYIDKLNEDELVEIKNSFDYKYSVVFELRYNGFTYKEISILLDLPMNTIRSRIAKIKKTLQKRI